MDCRSFTSFLFLLLLMSSSAFFLGKVSTSSSVNKPSEPEKIQPQSTTQLSELQRKLYPFEIDVKEENSSSREMIRRFGTLYTVRSDESSSNKKGLKRLFTKDAEMLNSRLAMIGLSLGLLREEITGESLIQQIHHFWSNFIFKSQNLIIRLSENFILFSRFIFDLSHAPCHYNTGWDLLWNRRLVVFDLTYK